MIEKLYSKKIYVKIIMVALSMLLLSLIFKTPYDYELMQNYNANKITPPLSEYYTNLIIIDLPLDLAILISVLMLCVGIYGIMYKDDKEAKKFLKDKAMLISNALEKSASKFRKFYSGSHENEKEDISRRRFYEIKSLIPINKLEKKGILNFALKYIAPILIILIIMFIYLGTPLSEIDKKKLDLFLSYRVLEQVEIRLENNVDYAKIYTETLMRSNPLNEIADYRSLRYARDLLNLCGKSSFKPVEREILKHHSSLHDISDIPQTNSSFKLYRNLAFFTIILIVLILLFILMKYKKHPFINWLLYFLFVYCILHVIVLNLNRVAQKDLDITLKKKFKIGCLQREQLGQT